MKRRRILVVLFFLWILLSLVFATVHSGQGQPGPTSEPWPTPEILPGAASPTPQSGWWEELPTPIPIPSPTSKH